MEEDARSDVRFIYQRRKVMTTEIQTSKVNQMSDVELLEFCNSSSEEAEAFLTSMAKAQIAGTELSPDELRLQKLVDAVIDDFISQDKERKRTAFDEFILYLTKKREDILVTTWVFDHANELYRWAERPEAK
jgi:hypothetical protein